MVKAETKSTKEVKVKKPEVKVAEESIAKETIAEIKRKQKEEEHGKLLWCENCQRGLGDLGKSGKYRSGDKCPMCLDKYRMRKDKEDISGILQTITEVLDFKKKRAEYIIAEKKRNEVKYIKGPDELVKEAESRMKRENEALKQELEQLKDLIKQK